MAVRMRVAPLPYEAPPLTVLKKLHKLDGSQLNVDEVVRISCAFHEVWKEQVALANAEQPQAQALAIYKVGDMTEEEQVLSKLQHLLANTKKVSAFVNQLTIDINLRKSKSGRFGSNALNDHQFAAVFLKAGSRLSDNMQLLTELKEQRRDGKPNFQPTPYRRPIQEIATPFFQARMKNILISTGFESLVCMVATQAAAPFFPINEDVDALYQSARNVVLMSVVLRTFALSAEFVHKNLDPNKGCMTRSVRQLAKSTDQMVTFITYMRFVDFARIFNLYVVHQIGKASVDGYTTLQARYSKTQTFLQMCTQISNVNINSIYDANMVKGDARTYNSEFALMESFRELATKMYMVMGSHFIKTRGHKSIHQVAKYVDALLLTLTIQEIELHLYYYSTISSKSRFGMSADAFAFSMITLPWMLKGMFALSNRMTGR